MDGSYALRWLFDTKTDRPVILIQPDIEIGRIRGPVKDRIKNKTRSDDYISARHISERQPEIK